MLRLAAAAILGLFLAGCAGAPMANPATEPAAAKQAPAAWLDWSQADCQSMTWSVPVLASSLQPYLPTGFEPSPGDAPVAAGQAATLGFRAVECATGFGEEEMLRSVQSGVLFTPVLPPAELRDERFATRYSFVWDTLVAKDEWRAAAAGWGMPVHDGGALVGPTAQGWTGALAMDRVGTFTATGRTVDGERPVEDRESRAVTLGGQGFALWDSSMEDLRVSTGVGVWSASPESWVAQVLGATQGAATFELAAWNLPRALVHWPGQALGPVEDGGATSAGPGLPDLPPPAREDVGS